VILGEVQLAAGQATQALPNLQEASRALSRLQVRLSPEHADLLVTTTQALLELSRPHEAVPLADQAARRWDELDAGNRSAGLAWLWLARAQTAAGQDSRAALDRAAAVLETAGGADDRALLQRTRHERGR
jgi:tetratricopeptide (TPR) repeat protein